MKVRNNCYAIVGGGIVGVSLGVKILEKIPNAKVTIFEKESNLGMHASGRNSGVLHAGFYYSPESLKARYCADGNRALRSFCMANGINVINTGKVVVAKNESDLQTLENLLERAISLDIPAEIHVAKRLPDFEPLARTHKAFIFSPTTGVASPRQILNALEKRFLDLRGEIKFNCNVNLIEKDGTIVLTNNKDIVADAMIINAAGSYSLELANKINIGTEYLNLPLLGNYRIAKSPNVVPKRLIYPVPHPANPFLGVHTTTTYNNDLKIGPTARPSFGSENYSGVPLVNFRQTLQSIKGIAKFALGFKHNNFGSIFREVLNVSVKGPIRSVESIFPAAKEIKNWESAPPGIRSQMVRKIDGAFETDFLVLEKKNSVHLLNIVSPGWTSALAIAETIANRLCFEF